MNEAVANGAPIQVEGVSYFFGKGELRKQILFDVSTEIAAGEIVILTGPSGSGKTTLLTLIGALRTCQEGAVKILGNALAAASEAELVKVRRRIGYIFQQHNLLTSLSVAQNVQMALELAGEKSRGDWMGRIEKVLEQVGMAEHIHKMPDQLSGGQKQRIGIARALVHHPSIILADEPTASLDKHSGRDVVELIQKLAREEGAAVVLVTHDNRILDIADRILHLEDGRIKNLMDAVGDETGRMMNVMARFEPSAYSELAAFALALTRVASADQQIDESENAIIRSILRDVSHLSEGETELVMQLSHSMLGLQGRPQDAATLEPGTEQYERYQQLLSSLHAVAEADGKVTDDELAEINRIAAELGLRQSTTV
ncbi:MAG: ATP-binding cassette domain-containing protein [Halioglobus sp.]|nr:ATP-binding cassette domain-containing protein [Halioglobus sp.]